jgi:hypothetical protein
MTPFRWERERVAVVQPGWPAALQITLRLACLPPRRRWRGALPLASAAHQVVLEHAGFIFMIPFGSGRAAVRVGQAVGRRDDRCPARRWAALYRVSGDARFRCCFS